MTDWDWDTGRLRPRQADGERSRGEQGVLRHGACGARDPAALGERARRAVREPRRGRARASRIRRPISASSPERARRSDAFHAVGTRGGLPRQRRAGSARAVQLGGAEALLRGLPARSRTATTSKPSTAATTPQRPSGGGLPQRRRRVGAAAVPRATCSPADPCPGGSGAGACRGESGASRACRSAPRRRASA